MHSTPKHSVMKITIINNMEIWMYIFSNVKFLVWNAISLTNWDFSTVLNTKLTFNAIILCNHLNLPFARIWKFLLYSFNHVVKTGQAASWQIKRAFHLLLNLTVNFFIYVSSWNFQNKSNKMPRPMHCILMWVPGMFNVTWSLRLFTRSCQLLRVNSLKCLPKESLC